MIINKCTTRETAAIRYGHIDLASLHWPNQGKWIKLFKVPEGWFPGWHVLDTDTLVEHIACNVDMHEPLMTALTEVKFMGLSHELHSFDGAFNIRFVRGLNSISTHAYGLGIDLNASENPLGVVRTTFSPTFVGCFKKAGFTWGGDFHHRKDNMHFSYAWE